MARAVFDGNLQASLPLTATQCDVLVLGAGAEFLAFGGMMVSKEDLAPLLHPLSSLSSLKHSLGLLRRYAVDRARYGSIMRGAYPGPGTTLGPALVFACQAAKHLSGESLLKAIRQRT